MMIHTWISIDKKTFTLGFKRLLSVRKCILYTFQNTYQTSEISPKIDNNNDECLKQKIKRKTRKEPTAFFFNVYVGDRGGRC